MQHTKMVHLWVGLFVAIGIASLFMLAMRVSNITAFAETEGYQLTLNFDNIGGLKVRSPVTMAGVVIGRVSEISFDKEIYEAEVKVTIENQYDNIPEDTSASIFTSGLLGEQYIGLEPGGADKFLEDGDRFKLTQSAVVLEQLIGQFLVSKASE